MQDGAACHGGYQNEADPPRIYNLTEEISLNICCQISLVKGLGQVSRTAFAEQMSNPVLF